MKKLISTLILLFPVIAYATTPVVVPSTDIIYLGAFKLPVISGYNWASGDQGGDSLKGLEILPGLPPTLLAIANRNNPFFCKDVAQISIPRLVNSKNLNLLNAGTLLKGPTDITGGRQTSGSYTILGDIHYLPKKGNQKRDHLYWSIYGAYQNQSVYNNSNGSFGWAETDITDTTTLSSQGAWRFKDCTQATGNPYICSAFSGKYLFHAPQDWADLYTGGRSLLTGYKSSSGNSSGPVIFAFAPWGLYRPDNVAGNDTNSIPPDARNNATPVRHELANPNHYFVHTPLLQYNQGPSAGQGAVPPYQVTDAAFNSFVTSARWISLGSKRAIVFAGSQCYRTCADFTFSYPANYYPAVDYAGDSEGYHSDPCSPVFWFYSQDDITAVAQGTKHVYDPQPYARMNLRGYLIDGDKDTISGMAYDESTQRLYVEENYHLQRGNTTSVIHVFQLRDVGSTLDTTPPSTPTIVLDSVNHTSVTFHWAAVIDDSGSHITYFIYRNGVPIAITSALSYTDNYLAYYLSPVDYQVKAADGSGNLSTSNTLRIDRSIGSCPNCGNAPMNIYIPSYCLPANHETSCLKIPCNEPYSYTPTVWGGRPPYTWSADALPTGLSINSSTGEISGKATGSGGSAYGYNITVRDSNGNIASRKTAMSTITIGMSRSYYCDRDQDGVEGTYPGCNGTDTNDYDCNVTPGATYVQPPPTGLTVTGSTSSTVSLSWTAAPKRSDPSYNVSSRNQLNGLDIGYQVYHGTLPGVYDPPIFVGRNLSYTLTGLSSGIHYFAVSAVEFRGLESTKSPAVVQTR